MVFAEHGELQAAREVFTKVNTYILYYIYCFLEFFVIYAILLCDFTLFLFLPYFCLFGQVREESKAQSTDVGINLAHVQLAQGRFPDAEHLYQATMKLMQFSSDATKMALLNEWTSLAQLSYRRFAESSLTAQKGVHLDPANLRLWHNIAVIHRDSSAALRAKQTRTVDDLEGAVLCLASAEQTFQYVASKKNTKFEVANKHLKACKVNQ